MKKLDLYIPVDKKGRAMSIQTQIVIIKKKINEMMDVLEETPNEGSILQFLDDEEGGK